MREKPTHNGGSPRASIWCVGLSFGLFSTSQRGIGHGGITDIHIEHIQGHSELIGSKGVTAQVVTALCECLAMMAFLPGGVNFAGLHFEARMEEEEATHEH